MVAPEMTAQFSKSYSPVDATMPSPSSSRCVTKDLGPNDVLLGRGTGPNEQIGNIRFRALVRDVIQSFGSKDLDGKEKTRLAKSVMKEVKAKGGRFVRRVESGASTDKYKNSNRAGDLYEEVTDALALDKTKQSFRHQLRGTKMPSSSSSSSDILLPEKRKNENNDEPPEPGQGFHKGTERQRISDSIIRQRSLSLSSSGGAATSSPSQRSSTSSSFLADGILQLKALQHERNDYTSLAPSSPATLSSLIDPHLLMGLRNSLLPGLPSSTELMRKELASRYLLAESILLGGGGRGGVLEQALIAHSQHLGLREGLPLGVSSYYLPTTGMMQHHLGGVRSHQIYSSSSTAQPIGSFDPCASHLFESARVTGSRYPPSFAAFVTSPSKKD